MCFSAPGDSLSGAASQRIAAIASSVTATGGPVVGLTGSLVVESLLVVDEEGEVDEAIDAAALVSGAIDEPALPHPAKIIKEPTRTAAFENRMRATTRDYAVGQDEQICR